MLSVFFRSHGFRVPATVFIIGTAAWLHVFAEFRPCVSDRYGTFLFREISSLLAGIPSLYTWLGLALFLLSIAALISVNNRLYRFGAVSYLPALCYVLLVGGVPNVHLFSPALIAVIVLMVAFSVLAGSFESEQLSYRFFTASALIAFATFFCRYMYVYMLAVWIAIALWRPGYWREWVFSVLGFAAPLLLAFSWFFLTCGDITWLGNFLVEIFSFQRSSPALPAYTVVFFVPGIVTLLITFRYMLRYAESGKNTVRTGYYVLAIIAAVTAALVCAVPDMIPFAWYMLAFPASFIISVCLAGGTRPARPARTGIILLCVLFAGAIVSQLLYLSKG